MNQASHCYHTAGFMQYRLQPNEAVICYSECILTTPATHQKKMFGPGESTLFLKHPGF